MRQKQSSDNSRVYEKLDKIEEKFERKFDKLEVRADNMEKELIVYNEHLKTHIEGVNQARRQNDMLREYLDVKVKELEDDMRPVVKHVEKLTSYMSVLGKLWKGMISFLGFISLLSGIMFGILKYMGMI